MHLLQHKLCTRKMELALEVKFISTFTEFTRPWWRTLTNGSDVKYVFLWCVLTADSSCRVLSSFWFGLYCSILSTTLVSPMKLLWPTVSSSSTCNLCSQIFAVIELIVACASSQGNLGRVKIRCPSCVAREDWGDTADGSAYLTVHSSNRYPPVYGCSMTPRKYIFLPCGHHDLESAVKVRTHDATLRATCQLHRVSTPEIVARHIARNRKEFYFSNIASNNCTVSPLRATLHATVSSAS